MEGRQLRQHRWARLSVPGGGGGLLRRQPAARATQRVGFAHRRLRARVRREGSAADVREPDVLDRARVRGAHARDRRRPRRPSRDHPRQAAWRPRRAGADASRGPVEDLDAHLAPARVRGRHAARGRWRAPRRPVHRRSCRPARRRAVISTTTAPTPRNPAGGSHHIIWRTSGPIRLAGDRPATSADWRRTRETRTPMFADGFSGGRVR